MSCATKPTVTESPEKIDHTYLVSTQVSINDGEGSSYVYQPMTLPSKAKSSKTTGKEVNTDSDNGNSKGESNKVSQMPSVSMSDSTNSDVKSSDSDGSSQHKMKANLVLI